MRTNVAPPLTATTPLRVGIVCDLLEEQWPSMDLTAAMLRDGLAAHPSRRVVATSLCPAMVRRASRVAFARGSRHGQNVDRLVNRFVDYPRWLLGHRDRYDVFHIVDHSYAQLAHVLPADRTVVTCHDLDTFRSILGGGERRGPFFRAMTRRILSGLQRVACVTCDSAATRAAILAHDLVPPERLVVAPLGVSPVFSPRPDPAADARVAALLGPPDPSSIEILHVGSTISRKRIDVVLGTFAAIRARHPRARLVRVGGRFTAEQEALAGRLGLDRRAVAVAPYLDTAEVAAVYRRAAVVLLPSDAEGFGFPVVEALASGTPLVASDLPVLREVGGSAAVYAPPGCVPAWIEAVDALLDERRTAPERWCRRHELAIRQAANFSWSRFADQMVRIYETMAGA